MEWTGEWRLHDEIETYYRVEDVAVVECTQGQGEDL